jgi:hypothetical protein
MIDPGTEIFLKALVDSNSFGRQNLYSYGRQDSEGKLYIVLRLKIREVLIHCHKKSFTFNWPTFRAQAENSYTGGDLK